MIKAFSKYFTAAGCGLAMLAISGCQSTEEGALPLQPKAEQPDGETPQAAKVRAHILSLGFPPGQIVSEADRFVVDGCISFMKDMAVPVVNPLAKKSQYNQGRVNQSVSRTIRVRVDDNMAGEIPNVDAALLVLNRSFSDLHFTRVSTSNQHILLANKTITPTPIWSALAAFPSASYAKPGPTIDVNARGAYWQTGDNLRRRVLIHELLHCVGMVHNQEKDAGGNNIFPGGSLVTSTPDFAHEDPFSIMHAPGDWYYEGRDIGWENALSRYDHMAIQHLYPYWRNQRSADVNGDRKADMILVQASNNAVSYKLSNGSSLGSTLTAGTFGDQAGQYFTGDINGDGRSDLLFGKTGAITIRYSNGNGFDAPQALVSNFGSTGYGGGYQTLDFNGDGRDDVMFVEYTSAKIWIMLSTGKALGATYSKVFGDRAGQYFVGDFNGDNKDDIFCANRPTQDIANPSTLLPHTVDIIYSNGTSFGAVQQLICGDCFGHISWGGMYMSADFNNDKKDDIIFKDVNGKLIVALSTGSGLGTVIGSTTGMGDITTFFHVGDFNGDGRADVFGNAHGGMARVQFSNGSSWGTITSLISIGFGNLASGDSFF